MVIVEIYRDLESQNISWFDVGLHLLCQQRTFICSKPDIKKATKSQ